MSPLKRMHRAGFDLKCHFLWIPKYRKVIFREDISKREGEVFLEIAKVFEFDIEGIVVEGHAQLVFDYRIMPFGSATGLFTFRH